jgi:hypothetical protein
MVRCSHVHGFAPPLSLASGEPTKQGAAERELGGASVTGGQLRRPTADVARPGLKSKNATGRRAPAAGLAVCGPPAPGAPAIQRGCDQRGTRRHQAAHRTRARSEGCPKGPPRALHRQPGLLSMRWKCATRSTIVDLMFAGRVGGVAR